MHLAADADPCRSCGCSRLSTRNSTPKRPPRQATALSDITASAERAVIEGAVGSRVGIVMSRRFVAGRRGGWVEGGCD